MSRRAVSETRLWSWLNNIHQLRIQGVDTHQLHMYRVENLISYGGPDTGGCYLGACFEIELKCSSRPARPTTPIKCEIQPTQIPWHTQRRLAGGVSFVLLQVASDRDARRYLLPGVEGLRWLRDGIEEEDLQPYYTHNNRKQVIEGACGFLAAEYCQAYFEQPKTGLGH